jgi:hypothetical protein
VNGVPVVARGHDLLPVRVGAVRHQHRAERLATHLVGGVVV